MPMTIVTTISFAGGRRVGRSLFEQRPLISLNLLALICLPAIGQDSNDHASINSSIGPDGTGTIVVQATGTLPEPALIFQSKSDAKVVVGADRILQTIQLAIRVLQGKAKKLTLGLTGDGEVTGVQGENVQSWSVRRVGEDRFLDLQLDEDVEQISAEITVESDEYKLPTTLQLTHLSPGETVGFDSTVAIVVLQLVRASLANSFLPVALS